MPLREWRRGGTYRQEMLAVLTVLWEAAGYPWSVRLKTLVVAELVSSFGEAGEESAPRCEGTARL